MEDIGKMTCFWLSYRCIEVLEVFERKGIKVSHQLAGAFRSVKWLSLAYWNIRKDDLILPLFEVLEMFECYWCWYLLAKCWSLEVTCFELGRWPASASCTLKCLAYNLNGTSGKMTCFCLFFWQPLQHLPLRLSEPAGSLSLLTQNLLQSV